MSAFLDAGARVAGYRIDRFIGRGGMGVVYLAEQLRLRRHVALKVIAPEYAGAPGFRKRFERESELAAAIDHPHVIPVYEADESDGLLFISMRFVDGPDLRELVEQAGRLEPEFALRVIAQIGSALDAAHARGLIHRDVKPANVLLDRGQSLEHAYLTDFGLTKRLGSSANLTGSREWLGTPDYCAPEQIQGGDIDGGTDQYSLGCVLHACLTGAPPFPRDNEVAALWAQVHDPPPRLSDARNGMPAEVDDVLARALAKSPEARFGSCAEFVAALESAFDGRSRAPTVPEERPVGGPGQPSAVEPRRARRPLPWTPIALVLAALMLGATALVLTRGGASQDEGSSGRVGGPSPSGGGSQRAAIDDASARAILRRYVETYEAHDGAAFASLFAPGVQRAQGCGPVVQRGAGAVLAAYESQWRKQSAPTYRLSIGDVTSTGAEASVRARFEIADPSLSTTTGTIRFHLSDDGSGRASIDDVRVEPDRC